MRIAQLFLLMTLAASPATAAGPCAAPSLTLAAAVNAALDVTLAAPCHGGEAVILSHAGLGFRVRLDAQGRYGARLPALDPGGDLSARFDDGTMVDAARPVPDLGDHRRLTLATRGGAPLRLQAGVGVRLTLLGDPTLPAPQLLQIADLPPGLPQPGSPPPDLALIADVTPQSCGHDLLATTLLTAGTAAPRSDAISLAMPDCAPGAGAGHLSLDLSAQILAAPPPPGTAP